MTIGTASVAMIGGRRYAGTDRSGASRANCSNVRVGSTATHTVNAMRCRDEDAAVLMISTVPHPLR